LSFRRLFLYDDKKHDTKHPEVIKVLVAHILFLVTALSSFKSVSQTICLRSWFKVDFLVESPALKSQRDT